MNPVGWMAFLRRVALTWLALSVVTVGTYMVVYFGMDAPERASIVFTPLMFVYWPAWALALSIFGGDFPLIEFGAFVLVENLLIAIALVGVYDALGRRRAGAPRVPPERASRPA